MTQSTHADRVIELARQRYILRASDLDAIGVPRVVLGRLTRAGRLQKVGRGLYTIEAAPTLAQDGLLAIASRVPQAVFCLTTALQFHELTTQLPREVWFAMPRGSHLPRIDYPPIKMVQMSGDVYASGVETQVLEGVTVRVFNVAKTVADCFKHRSKVGLDVAIEALKDARAKNKATVDELWQQAKVCRVDTLLRPYLEAIE